jgi:NADH-quinone oxidoreductase subunit C
MTYEQAAQSIGERFSDVKIEVAAPLVVSVPVGRWEAFAQFAKETLGCRFFSFLSAVDWKEQGLEVVARVENLDDRLAITMKSRLGPGVSECRSLVPVYRGADWM